MRHSRVNFNLSILLFLIGIVVGCVRMEPEQLNPDSSNVVVLSEDSDAPVADSVGRNINNNGALIFTTPAGQFDSNRYFRLDVSKVGEAASTVEILNIYGSTGSSSVSVTGEELKNTDVLSVLSTTKDYKFIVEILYKNGATEEKEYINSMNAVLEI